MFSSKQNIPKLAWGLINLCRYIQAQCNDLIKLIKPKPYLSTEYFIKIDLKEETQQYVSLDFVLYVGNFLLLWSSSGHCTKVLKAVEVYFTEISAGYM